MFLHPVCFKNLYPLKKGGIFSLFFFFFLFWEFIFSTRNDTCVFMSFIAACFKLKH